MSSRLMLLAFFEEQQHAVVGFGRAEAVDAGDGADDDGVAAFEEGAGGGEAELVELLVDGGFFLDVEVAGGDVGFGLVVVVVGDEVFDGVAGEELFELVVELGGEGLVVGEDEGGAVGLLDDLGHGEGLAGAGDAEEDLVLFAGGEAVDELVDGAGLVALGLVGGDELKVHLGIIAEKRRRGERWRVGFNPGMKGERRGGRVPSSYAEWGNFEGCGNFGFALGAGRREA